MDVARERRVRPIGRGWILALLPPLLIVAVAAYLTLYFGDRLRAGRDLVLHTQSVMEAARVLLSDAQDAETGQRGFIITERPDYLQPYEAARAAIPGRVAALRQLLADDGAQLARVDELERLLATKLAELARTVALSRRGDSAAARAEVLSDRGKAAMDGVRRVVGEIVAAQGALLAARVGETTAAETRTLYAAMAGSALGLVGIAAGAVLLLASNRRLRRAEAELAAQGALLQATLDHARDGVAAFAADGRLVAWNAKFFGLLDLPADLARRGTGLEELRASERGRELPALADAGGAGPGSADAARQVEVGGRRIEVAGNPMPGGGRVVSCTDVTRRLQAEAIVRQAQKMEAIGHLTGGVAHDFNNLLQTIGGNLDLLARAVPPDDRAAAARLAGALDGVARGARLTGQLLAFARRQPLSPRVVNLGRVVRGLGDLLARTLGEPVEVETVVAGGLWNTAVDPSQVENAVLNLAINARDAMPGGGKLTIELANAFLDDAYAAAHAEVTPGQHVLLAVSDTGVGMPPDVAARAFEPFFTTKPEGQGTGLGLSQVYGFVKQSGGHIKIYSEVGEGTTVRVYLPRSRRPEQRPEPAAAGGEAVVGGSETVLVVEDDPAVRDAAVETLTELGYRVLQAGSGEAALAVLAGGTRVDLLFTDVVMPGPVRTRELARRAQELSPGLAVLYTSGYTENAILHDGRLDEGVLLLSKPYRRDDLACRVRQALEAARRASRPGSSTSTVLVVEDDALIRMATVEMLHGLGRAALEAGTGGEALALLRRRPEIGLLVTDLGLPGMDGEALAAAARDLRPGLSIVVASGRAPASGDLNGGSPAGVVWLPKPFLADDLARALAAAATPPAGSARLPASELEG